MLIYITPNKFCYPVRPLQQYAWELSNLLQKHCAREARQTNLTHARIFSKKGRSLKKLLSHSCIMWENLIDIDG
jgi:hypothetical protein